MNPIMIVCTSLETLGETGRNSGLWLEEVVGVYCRFQCRGIPVTVASPHGGAIPIDPKSMNVRALSPEARSFISYRDPVLKNSVALNCVHANDFDAVFYPGGHGPMWDLADDLRNARLLGAFFDCGKIVGAVCHGPAALLKARRRNGDPVIYNRRITAFSDAEEGQTGLDDIVPFSLEQRLKEAGGIYSCREPWMRHIVVDGNLVTGQNPQSTIDVAEAMLELLHPAQLAVRKQEMKIAVETSVPTPV